MNGKREKFKNMMTKKVVKTVEREPSPDIGIPMNLKQDEPKEMYT